MAEPGAPRQSGLYAVGGVWIQDGMPVVFIGGDYRGAFPETWFLPFTGQAGTNDNDVVYTSPDISGYGRTVIECTAGTVDIEVSVDGTNWNSTPPAVLLHDATAVGTFSLTIANGKIGIYVARFKKIRVKQNGATASNARGFHSGW